LTQILTSTPLTIAAHGRVALYIDGIVNPSAPLAFVLDPMAEFDIFIADTIKSSQTLVIGSPNYPALSRTYVGGTAKLSFSQDVRIGGQFYAANSAPLRATLPERARTGARVGQQGRTEALRLRPAAADARIAATRRASTDSAPPVGPAPTAASH